MVCATRLPSRVRAPNPRSFVTSPWRTALKALSGGLWLVAIGLTSVGTVLMGLGWLVAVSTSARSAVQPIAAFSIPPGSLSLAALPADTIAEKTSEKTPMRVDASAAVADRFVFNTAAAVAEPMGRFAMATPAAFAPTDDLPFYTGSITPPTAKLTARDDGPAVPTPRNRPKLASLGPIGDLGIKPAEAPHPPRTAIYDITAQVVYLPNGERLEAHSGLGDFMDNPSSARHRNRGVTPPNTYDLTLRESLFHGVQAIRLNPVDENKMFGRDGMLAHSYMLGPNGQSNGCISFKDYPRFLRAFQRGEIERIVVVPRWNARRNRG